MNAMIIIDNSGFFFLSRQQLECMLNQHSINAKIVINTEYLCNEYNEYEHNLHGLFVPRSR